MKYDNELTVIPVGSCEIALGNTNRLVSDNALDVLRYGEYLCRWDDGTLVICGRSDFDTTVAIDRFIDEILPICSKYSLMPAEAHFECMKNYALKQIILNEYDLYDYAITYSDEGSDSGDSIEERNVAIAIRDIINSKSGYYLDIIPNSLITSKSSRFISLTDEGDENAIIPKENEIALSGTDSYALWRAAKQFVDDIFESASNGVIDFNYNNKAVLDFVDTSFESAFCFLKENDSDLFKPTYELITLLRSGRMGVCFVGNSNDKLKEDFDSNISSPIKYQEIFVGSQRIMLAYDERKIDNISIRVDKSEKYISVDIKTKFNERISYIYIIDNLTSAEMPSINANTVIFCNNCDMPEYDGVYCAAQGYVNLLGGKNKYCLANDLNLSIENSNIVSNTENLLCFSLKTKVACPSEMLNYALK